VFPQVTCSLVLEHLMTKGNHEKRTARKVYFVCSIVEVVVVVVVVALQMEEELL